MSAETSATRREVTASSVTRREVTTFEVDVDDLREVVGAMGACQRRLLDLAADVEALHAALEPDWSGLAADAHIASYRRWRDDCAEMVTALAGLRAVVEAADGHYRGSVAANLALWEHVR